MNNMCVNLIEVSVSRSSIVLDNNTFPPFAAKKKAEGFCTQLKLLLNPKFHCTLTGHIKKIKITIYILKYRISCYMALISY